MLNSAFVSMYTLHGLCSRFYPHLPVFLVLAAGESSTSIRPNGISCIRRSSGSGSDSCSGRGSGSGSVVKVVVVVVVVVVVTVRVVIR